MADLKLIFQAATKQTHASQLNTLLAIADPVAALLSVAFVREAGVDLIAGALKALKGNVAAYVGIRNDITSIQGVQRLVNLGVDVFGVDTGSRHIIFHPKIYLASSKTHADAIIGSANLTFSGLNNNIEASTRVTLDLAEADDAQFVKAVFSAFEDLPKSHPEHVFRIKNASEITALFEEGRLVDETFVPAPKVTEKPKAGARDKLPKMKLWFVPPPAPSAPPVKKLPAKAAATAVPAVPVPAVPVHVGPVTPVLVWESKGLTQRDLNIPKGFNTNPTGSMGMKMGAYENIDHRHYFRDVVFAGLGWHAKGPHHEVATADFELVVKNLNCGSFSLLISHNTDTTSATYKQKNMMTHLHWGDAKPVVAQNDLLGRILYLYRRETVPPTFVIEID
jgi:HKD family nuclease